MNTQTTNDTDNTQKAGCEKRLVRALGGKVAYLRAEATRMSHNAEILCGLIPEISNGGEWVHVNLVDLETGKHYAIRRNYAGRGPCDPCVARWDACAGWAVIYGHLPSGAPQNTLEVCCPNVESSHTCPGARLRLWIKG